MLLTSSETYFIFSKRIAQLFERDTPVRTSEAPFCTNLLKLSRIIAKSLLCLNSEQQHGRHQGMSKAALPGGLEILRRHLTVYRLLQSTLLTLTDTQTMIETIMDIAATVDTQTIIKVGR